MRHIHKIIITTPSAVYEYSLEQLGGSVPHKGDIIVLTPAAAITEIGGEIEKVTVITVVYDMITGVVYLYTE